MYCPLGKPELVPHDPPAVMRVVVENGPASRAAVGVRRPRVELEHRSVLLASSPTTRHARLLRRNEQFPSHQRFEILRQRLRECMQRFARGLATRVEIGSMEQNGHWPA